MPSIEMSKKAGPLLVLCAALAACGESPVTNPAVWEPESNHPATRAMIAAARHLGKSGLSDALRTHSENMPFSGYYLKFVREGNFAARRRIVNDSGPVITESDEQTLGLNLTDFDRQFEAAGDTPIPLSVVQTTLFSLCQLATYAVHLDLAVADELAGSAAALLAWLESSMQEEPSIRLFRGWIFYLAGDAPGGRRELSECGGEPWKSRAEALDFYIQSKPKELRSRLDKSEPWLGMLYAMSLESEDVDEAVKAYKRQVDRGHDNLLPMLTVGGLIELGNPQASKHEVTEAGAWMVLDAAVPGDASLPEKYKKLLNLGNTRAILTPLMTNLYLGYFRRGVFTRHEFVENVLAANAMKKQFLEELAEIGDPILDYLAALTDIRESRLSAGADRFRKIAANVRDPYLLERLNLGLPEEWGAPFVNEVQDHPYESWRYYRHAGLLCARYGWFRKATRFLNNSLALNPYQEDLKKIVATYKEMSAGPDASFNPQNDPALGTQFAFSIWSPEVDRAIEHIRRNPEFVPKEEGMAFDLTTWMEFRGEYKEAIEFAERCLDAWPENIFAANLSAKIGWIHLKRLKDVETARKQFEKMEWFNNGSNLLGLAECYEKLGDAEEAERRYLDDDERYGQADKHFPLAAYYIRRGEYEKALDAINDPDLFSGPNPRREFVTYALTFYVDESYPTLVQMLYEKVIPDRKSWISYDYSQWALSYMLMQNYAKVEEIVAAAKKSRETNPFLDYFRYVIACKQKNWPQAAQAIQATTGKYYHRYLPGALVEGKEQAELEEYSRGKPQYQSYLSTMYGLLAYRHIAKGSLKEAEKFFKLDAGSIRYSTWHIPILASYEIGERIPVTGPSRTPGGSDATR